MNNDPLLIALVTGFVTSVFSSLFLYLMMWSLKPDVEISPKIAHYTLHGQDRFHFKVINKTWFNRVINVKCELLLLQDVNVDGGTNVAIITIPLVTDQTWYIKRRCLSEKGSYAAIFSTTENLDERWSNPNTQRLQFQLICKHALSGFSKVFAFTYYRKQACIVNGAFAFGDTFRIN